MRKLDFMLIPWLSFLYLVSFLDRTNIGNAKIDGLVDDLKMTDGQYNAALSLFFVSYAGFEPLTNILLKRLRPSVFIPIIMVLWGICMTCMGLVHDFSGLAAARFFLGVAEAGLFPGVNCKHSVNTAKRLASHGRRLSVLLVQAQRVRHPRSHLLLRCRPCWILRWLACGCHCADGGDRREARLGVDFYP